MEAAKEACGLPTALLDPCNGDRPGFFRSLGLVARTGPNKGMRSYAARTYFLQYAERPNLNVICSALASKVVLEGKTARAVEFEHVGNKYTIKARQEVIICCGAIQTPQLLELSGIGDPQVLRKAGVECKIELPSVGRNYQDHICSGMSYELKAGNLSLDAIWSPDVMADAQCLYQEQQRGPLSSQLPGTGFFPHRTFATDAELDETIASIRATQREPRTSELYKTQLENVVSRLEDRCGGDLQLLILPATLHWKDATEDQSRLHTPMDPAEPHGFSLMVGLQYPVSRGSIHITSADPKVQPAIDPAYLSHPADVAVLSAGIKFLDKLVNIQNMSSKIAKRTLPEPDVDLTNTEVASAHVRDFCTQEYHSCGTCAMGEVLDSRLRVKGVEGLRICDASAFPAFVSGNIISTVYAMAEKAADMIKEDCRAT